MRKLWATRVGRLFLHGVERGLRALDRALRRASVGVLVLATLVACERRQEPGFDERGHHWERVPLGVYVEPDVGYAASLREARELWNDAVGCRVFVVSLDPATADVIVAIGSAGDAPNPELHAAGTFLRVSASRTVAEVYYYAPSTIDVAFKVFAHEFGHVLGLAHDPGFSYSIMRPDAVEIQVVRVSDGDRKLLRDRYCR